MAVNKFIKYSIFIFNFVFWIYGTSLSTPEMQYVIILTGTGCFPGWALLNNLNMKLIGCIILGVVIHIKVNYFGSQILNMEIPSINLLIAIGAVIMVLGFLGCCGAVRESRCMLLLFFIGLLLIFILLLAAGILGVTGQSQVVDRIKTFTKKHSSLATMSAEYNKTLNLLEEKGKCCGLSGPNDWHDKIPDSCNCKDKSAGCKNEGGKSVYSTPCVVFLYDFLKKNLKVAAGIGFAIGVVMLIGMTFAMTLYCQIGQRITIRTS